MGINRVSGVSICLPGAPSFFPPARSTCTEVRKLGSTANNLRITSSPAVMMMAVVSRVGAIGVLAHFSKFDSILEFKPRSCLVILPIILLFAVLFCAPTPLGLQGGVPRDPRLRWLEPPGSPMEPATATAPPCHSCCHRHHSFVPRCGRRCRSHHGSAAPRPLAAPHELVVMHHQHLLRQEGLVLWQQHAGLVVREAPGARPTSLLVLSKGQGSCIKRLVDRATAAEAEDMGGHRRDFLLLLVCIALLPWRCRDSLDPSS